MYAIFIATLMGTLMAFVLLGARVEHDAALAYARADREAMEVMAYKKAILHAICENPGVEGSIGFSELKHLPGMTRTKWSHHIEDGRIFLYTADALKTRTLADALRRRFDVSSIYILASDRSARALFARTATIPLFPGAIAANSLVVTVPIQNDCRRYPGKDKTIKLDDGTVIDLIGRTVTTPGGATISFSETVLVNGAPIDSRIVTILADKTRIATNGKILTVGPHAIELDHAFVRIDGQEILWKAS